MTEPQIPDWAAEGKTVLVASGGYGRTHFTEAKVVRTTKTRVIVNAGDTANKNTERTFYLPKYGGSLRELGRGDTWHSAPSLHSIDDPMVARARARDKVDTIMSKAFQVLTPSRGRLTSDALKTIAARAAAVADELAAAEAELEAMK